MNSDQEKLAYLKNLTLLYVEDSAASREMTTMILELFFKEVIIAVDGEDGYEKFNENKIDMVIADINMPKLNGLELCSKIREIDSDIPLVVLSAHNEQSYVDESIEAGVENYLFKPIDIDKLNDVFLKISNQLKKD